MIFLRGGSFTRRQWWFRIFGWGLRFADRSIHPPMFAEREGLEFVFRIGNWSIKPLYPSQLK